MAPTTELASKQANLANAFDNVRIERAANAIAEQFKITGRAEKQLVSMFGDAEFIKRIGGRDELKRPTDTLAKVTWYTLVNENLDNNKQHKELFEALTLGLSNNNRLNKNDLVALNATQPHKSMRQRLEDQGLWRPKPSTEEKPSFLRGIRLATEEGWNDMRKLINSPANRIIKAVVDAPKKLDDFTKQADDWMHRHGL
jgi:hypothetical protein